MYFRVLQRSLRFEFLSVHFHFLKNLQGQLPIEMTNSTLQSPKIRVEPFRSVALSGL